MNATTLLPSFASAVQKLHDLLLPVCLVLAFAGLIYKIVSLFRERSATSHRQTLSGSFHGRGWFSGCDHGHLCADLFDARNAGDVAGAASATNFGIGLHWYIANLFGLSADSVSGSAGGSLFYELRLGCSLALGVGDREPSHESADRYGGESFE
jgi:phosphotransferase system  glucose/maltose/N-acetylglucosamine-specific IIC component